MKHTWIKFLNENIDHDAGIWSSIEEIKDIDDTEIPIYLLEQTLDMSKNAK
jgi:hypothetical protein